MTSDFIVLATTAASIGFFHNLFGPDHYLPFIVMGKARKWSVSKTLWITSLCGLGHVLGSVVLGIFGIGLGIILNKLNWFEEIRGDLASWFLIVFGFVYAIWGIRYFIGNVSHTHQHLHDDGSIHEHPHKHSLAHAHVHNNNTKNITPWVLFVIFVLGPCEPLIPLLMYPAIQMGSVELFWIVIIFGSVTISTMLGVVLFSTLGLQSVNLDRFEKYSHTIAGLMILLSGVAIKVLGL